MKKHNSYRPRCRATKKFPQTLCQRGAKFSIINHGISVKTQSIGPDVTPSSPSPVSRSALQVERTVALT